MDLKNSKIMVTNDDSIYANGIKILESIAQRLSNDVWVIAPDAEQSAKSHSLTLDKPLTKKKISDKRFAVSGTPTDCVIMGVHHILKEEKPDLILSGINHGVNLAEDVHYSGTIAAAVEATMLGFPAIAISFATPHGEEDVVEHWDTVSAYLPDLIEKLTQIGWPKGILLNINFPNIPRDEITGVQITKQGNRDAGFSLVETKNPRNKPFFWISGYEMPKLGAADTDLKAIEEKAISITPLAVDLTHTSTLEKLKSAF